MLHRTCLGMVVICCAATGSAPAAIVDRGVDPVILTGSDVPPLMATDVGALAAYRFDNGWVQIPLQVDERKFLDFGLLYDQGAAGRGFTGYADASTYAGPEFPPVFDPDDELVFMVGDAGMQAPDAVPVLPAGVMLPGVELVLTDPLDGDEAYVYVFRTDGSIDQAAGAEYVNYTFDLIAGTYLPDYVTVQGPNPEDSAVTTANYRVHFSDRWIRDETNVYAGGSTAVDILDRQKIMFAPGNCTRTEDMFAAGPGAFAANIAGPVRGIRSYIGASDGPFTQRDHFFYAAREDVATYLRVHQIPGITDLFDYSPDAAGMLYHDDLNQAGVVIDGVPDTVATGALLWQMVVGAPGALIMLPTFDTDIADFAYTSYYSDDSSPARTQCTGDAFEYGTSGVWVDEEIPNTDPVFGAYSTLVMYRVIYYAGPGTTTAEAQQRRAALDAPLTVNVLDFTREYLGDLNCDGEVGFGDINPFVDALIDLDDYYSKHPDCDHNLADVNMNGSVGFDDINPFVELIAGI